MAPKTVLPTRAKRVPRLSLDRLPTWLSGSALLLVSMTVVNAGNYLYNLILGRWLGPVDYADLSLMVTLMLMVTFITATLQLTAAKFAATYHANQELDRLAGLNAWLGRVAVFGGIGLALVFVLGASFWQTFFHTRSAWPFVILGIGLPIYFWQGVGRGILQGQTRFMALAGSYQAEMWARLGVGLALVGLGWSVNGAVWGITASFVATFLVVQAIYRRGEVNSIRDRARESRPSFALDQRRAVTRYAWPVLIVHVSQILINNSDILIVKRFFPATEAGIYAALALIGRVVFFATWSVVTTLFPIVAQKHAQGDSHRHLLWAGCGLVAAISACIVAATWFFPELIINALFGADYLSVAPLLWLYAIATALYALANVIVTYRLSVDNMGGTFLATAAGIAQVVGLWLFHASLRQVVIYQICLMALLVLVLLVWDTVLVRRSSV